MFQMQNKAFKDMICDNKSRSLVRLGSMEKETLKNIVGIPTTEDNLKVMTRKKLVLDEFKRNPSYQNDSSDSEKESEINLEADHVLYGRTPPREIRRGKSKFKEKILVSKIYNNEKVKQEKRSSTPSARQKRMKEKRYMNNRMNENECIGDIPRASQHFVLSNYKQCLKSITQRKKASACNIRESLPTQGMPSVAQTTMRISYKQDRQSSKLQFYKSFSKMVKMGDIRESNTNNEQQRNEEETSEDSNIQRVSLEEVIWLELQAWQSNRSVEDQDCLLTEQRFLIDDGLDQVIKYKFQYANTSKTSPEEIANQKIDGEFITIKVSEHKDTNNSEPQQQHCQFNIEDIEKNEDVLDKSHFEHILAMKDVIDVLKKIENAERLYPSLRALSEEHPRYKDAKFNKNMQAMILWLNITKDIFHKIHLLADWIDVDPDDQLTWKDWFQHGLGLRCVKTNQRYQDTHYLSTGDMIDSVASSTDLNMLVSLGSARRTKKERKRLSHHRNSFIEKTPTSRYRMFAERALKDGGVYTLMKRLKDILHFTLEKTEYAFLDFGEEDQYLQTTHNEKVLRLLHCYKRIFPEKSADIFEDIYEKLKMGNQLSFLKGGLWGKVCQEMNLPSVLNLYVFLVEIPADIIHECIRFRIDCKPKVPPSFHSIKQLVNECKEVIIGGIICKVFVFDAMVLSLKESHLSQSIAKKLQNYDKDMKAILDLYFHYLGSWFEMLQKNNSTIASFKNIMENEWSFVKDISSYVTGAEMKAGHKFCTLVSNTLKTTSECLENYSEEKLSCCMDKISQCIHHSIPDSLDHKLMYKELKEKSLQALAFAKTLKKDLGVAAHYKVLAKHEHILKIIDVNNHVKLKFSCSTDYDVFIPCSFSKKPKKCFEVLKLNFDDNMEKGVSHHSENYIIVLKQGEKKVLWKGRTCHFDNTHNFSCLLPEISPLADMMLICGNSYHLKTQCKRIESIFDKTIEMVVDQSSSYTIIIDAIKDIKKAALKLAEISCTANQHFLECMSLRCVEMDEADKNTITKLFVEGLHCSFSFSFEYLRELVRFFHGKSREALMPHIIRCAKLWMDFVMSKTEKGRGKKPRWASQGLEFLLLAIDPTLADYFTNAEFRELQTRMQQCLSHIIGDAVPNDKKDKKHLREKRSSSPFTMHRSRSVPTRKSDSVVADRQDKKKTYSLPVDYNPNEDSSSLSVPDFNRTASSEFDTSVSDISFVEDIAEEVSDGEPELPATRIKKAIQEIDERRTAKLQHLRVIGNVTEKKANLASELVHLTLRKVNFKWQLGNKIGEGQFGQVFSSVNLDTGEVMAVKRIRFNPHDYGNIQDIADEITNIQGLQHDSLVRYYGVELHRDEMLIFMEYCADGTIAEISKLDLPESMIRVYTYQVTNAINFLHQNGVIHRDIKGANIFVSSSGLIKIGDFGSAVKLRDALATTHGEVFTLRGTAAFMAPEVITLDKGHGYGRAADIWSLGCVVVEMTTGKQPWVDLDNIYAIMFKVGDGQHPPIPERLSEEGQDFLQHCFVHDQEKRWTAHMLEDHPFVKCC